MNRSEIGKEIQNFISKSRAISRKESFSKTFDYIFENKDVFNFTVVETGTLRGDNEEVTPGDGGSTFLWGLFSSLTKNKCYTVDISKESIENSKFFTQEHAKYIEYVVSDSVSFLENFKDKIDLLYLDSFDSPLDKMEQASQHQLEEISRCYDKLSVGTLILLDDAPADLNGGKVKYSSKFLLDNGAKLIHQIYPQALFVK